MGTGTSQNSQPVKVQQNAKHFQPVEGSGMTDENFKQRIKTHETLYKMKIKRATILINPCYHLLQEMTTYQNLKETCLWAWLGKCGPERGPAWHKR